MKRDVIYVSVGLLCLGAYAVAGLGGQQNTQSLPIVFLQNSTPGTPQTGHINITGTMRATQFFGDGPGLANVDAALLNGLPGSSYLTSVPNPLSLSGATPSTISGTNTSSGLFATGITGYASNPSGETFGIFGNSAGSDGAGVYGVGSHLTGANFGVRGETSSPAGYGVYGRARSVSGGTRGVYGLTESTIGTGVFGEASSASGINFGGRFRSLSDNGYGVYSTGRVGVYGEGDGYGVEGLTNGSTGAGIAGYALSTSGVTFGGIFSARSPDGYGIYSHNLSTSGVAIAGYFETEGSVGRAIYARTTSATNGVGVWAVSEGQGGTGVIGDSNNTSGDGTGVWGSSTSASGQGVHGRAFSNTGTTIGVQGWAYSPLGIGVMGQNNDNIGVYGYAYGTAGTNYGVYGRTLSTSGRGILGEATAASGTTYGVRGATASAGGYGVYSVGNFGASGTKAFRIDHPFDPENRYLLHYSSESPFPQNFYNGNVVTDGNGFAWVELPDYFSSINANFKYQLTVIDDNGYDGFVQVKVNKKIHGNRFQIRTSAPNVEVSWTVTADRNDLFVRTNRPKDQIDKEESERGKLQHPELYGEKREKNMDFRPGLEGMKTPTGPRKG